MYELEKQGLPVSRQVSIPIRYEDLIIDNGYRVDLLVGEQIIVELKAVDAILHFTVDSYWAIFALAGSSSGTY